MTDAVERWSGEHLRYDIPHLRLRQVAQLASAKSPARVLDVGCATGHLRHLLPGVEYVGCDFTAPAVPPEFEFHRCDLNRDGLPAGLAGFDVVIASGILEYVIALPVALRDLVQRLKPSGTLICTYFNDHHFIRQATRRLGRHPYHHPDWTPLLPLAALQRQLETAGVAVDATYATSVSPGPARAVAATVHQPVILRRISRWNRPFAHQFILQCTRIA